MLFVIDVGNTHVVMGIYKDDKLYKDWRISTDKKKTSDEWAVFVSQLFEYDRINYNDISDVIISSVVPDLTYELNKMSREYLRIRPLIVTGELDTGIKIKLKNPGEVGADRVVNAVAAYEKYGGPVIIIDFGTATTFDVVTAAGEYLGGAITPGIGISIDALFSYAAKLPRVTLKKPPGVIGKDTIEGLQSGIIYGYASQVDGMVEKIKKELGSDVLVLATGGLSYLIAPECVTVNKIEKFLTLEGLKIIHDKFSRRDRDENR